MTRGSAPPLAKLIGQRYKKARKIGAGGMQEVFRAKDTSLSRDVALKEPMTPGAKKRFERSAIVSAKVVHPNVAATLDYIEDDGHEYLIEELVDGADLKTRFEKDFLGLDAHMAAHVLHHIAKGVAAAHHANVVHRDLKPSNIMVSPDPSLSTIKVTDFGIAKMAKNVLSEELKEAKDESTLTTSKTLVGAIPYMAPESLRQEKHKGFPADVWSVGAIGYWLLEGNPPFGDGLPAIAKILGVEALARPTKLGSLASLKPLEDELWQIIASCLDRKPENRPTADQLVTKFGELCYSALPRVEGVVERIGTQDIRSACFAVTSAGRVFFPKQSYLGFGIKLEVGLRVSLLAYPGRPYARAALALALKPAK